MMRVIKFRAWDKQLEEFMDIGRLYQEDDVYCVEEHPDVGDAYGFVGDKDGVVLMQYTGLKDKNGTEIYEGDICYDDHMNVRGKVVYAEGMFLYEWENIANTLFEVTKDIEVIGNIYEHPHLI